MNGAPKYCHHCCKADHNDSECWCTRADNGPPRPGALPPRLDFPRTSKTLLAALVAAALAGCSNFTLGTVLYCAKDTACDAQINPFRPAQALPAASSGAAGSGAVPVVKP